MTPWHKVCEELLSNKKYNLSEQEAFCLWYLETTNDDASEEIDDYYQDIFEASRKVYLSPVFDDFLDIDLALEGLREKGLISYEHSSTSRMLH